MSADQFPRTLQGPVVFVRPRGDVTWRAGEGLSDPVRRAVGRAVADWPLDRRIVLESPAGMAIVGLGDARQARAGALRAATDPGVAVAVTCGAVDLAADRDGVVRATGEAVDEATLLAHSGEGGLTESRSFADAARFEGRRRAIGVAVLAGLVLAGGGVRLVRERLEAARKPAVVQLDIKPSGEVFVDGEPKGTAPPLVKLWIAPGAHTIEVRHGRFKPLKLDVQLRPGEELAIAHNFQDGVTRRRSLLERLKFW